MKHRTSELTGKLLDAAVAQALGWRREGVTFWWDEAECARQGVGIYIGGYDERSWHPSTDWAQGGPIIERERIVVWPYTLVSSEDFLGGNRKQDFAAKRAYALDPQGFGTSYLEAAMRAYVANNLGEEVDLP